MLPSQLSKKVAKSKTKADEKKKAVVEEVEEEELVIPLHGLSSEDEDSSDDDDDDFQGDGPAVDVAKLPTIAKDDATVRRKLEKAKMKRTQVCISHNQSFPANSKSSKKNGASSFWVAYRTVFTRTSLKHTLPNSEM